MTLLFLIGMPAAGKTFWGSKLATEYHCHFIDIDELIEERERMSISAMFRKYGEDGFRQKEHALLQEIIDNNVDKTIVACGGGTPCHKGNMFLMKQAGYVIYLKAGIEMLLKNLSDDPDERPLLQNKTDVEGRMKSLLAERHNFYEQADFTLPVENLSLANFDQIINVCISRH